ncbi:MAG TPA: glycine C-acetyltransferase [Anaerolineae bacterium]|nr:glycine C-acetyltransferase [Anaerolineae bacterium]
MHWIEEEIAALQEQGLFVNLRIIDSPAGAWMVVDGKRVLNLCTNNYLGLANDPRLVQAAKAALDRFGAGPTAVRSIAGTLTLHRELEQAMAEFKHVEDALYVQAGFLANQAALPPLVGPEDVIFSDRLNHASIIDGARLSRAKIIVYEHCDLADLEARIKEHLPQYRRGLMVTDGVFSMDGDLAPLDALYEVCERYGVMTMVDDAHGEGVVGRGGRGIVDHFGLHGKFDVEIGTFSKAFGVVGGIIAGKKLIVDYLRQKARPFLFSSAVTPADTAACLAAVHVLSESTELVDRLWENTRYFKAAMKTLGFDTGQSVTPITPVMLGDVKLAREFSRRLFERGVFAMALGFPTVPKGLARIRVMVSAALTPEDLDFGLEQFAAVGRELGVIS